MAAVGSGDRTSGDLNSGDPAGGGPGAPAGRLRVEVAGLPVVLTHLERVLYPSGTTKAEVISYYAEVTEVMLPHLAGRPLTLVRYPDGVAAGGFFAKNVPGGAPSWVRVVTVRTGGDVLRQIVAQEPAALVWLANLAALEVHVPGWQVGPGGQETGADRLVIDLDPGAGTGLPECAALALALRPSLADDGLTAWPKTTGRNGLHLLVPVAPCPVDQVVGYAKALAGALAAAVPDRAVATIGAARRRGRVLLDWRQNVHRATTIAPYSLRGGDSPTVSAPLTWDEVAAIAAGEPLAERIATPEGVRARVAEHGDLLAGLLPGDGPRPELPPAPGH
jgi:bifunctional non-homologous end joining protein LigD